MSYATILKKYPVPEKDGMLTIYPDQTKLSGCWATRLLEWETLIKEELWKDFGQSKWPARSKFNKS